MYFKKNLQSVLKAWQVLNSKKKFFERRPNIEIPFFMILNPDFLLFFSVITMPPPLKQFRLVAVLRLLGSFFQVLGPTYDRLCIPNLNL